MSNFQTHPSAIIFVNNELTDGVRNPLKRQLYITEVISLQEFNARLNADPNYASVVHLNNLRILVEHDPLDYTNRNSADIVLYIKNGLAAIQKNNFGPHGATFPVDNLYLSLLILNK